MELFLLIYKNTLNWVYIDLAFFTVNKIECSWQAFKAYIPQHGIIE